MAFSIENTVAKFLGVQTAQAQSKAAQQDYSNNQIAKDWRVILRLAPRSNYLYNAPNPGILQPLKDTGGVIFPYTPTVNINYVANYDQTHPIHTNYKIFQYQNSGIDSVNITGTFTCKDAYEAAYLLAVIHFFKSMTKMFYGQDSDPKNGTPPPLCFIDGLGAFQFSQHPLVINSFTYNLPNDVDYIPTEVSGAPNTYQGTNRGVEEPLSLSRVLTLGLGQIFGGKKPAPDKPDQNAARNTNSSGYDTNKVTWVPSQIQLTINCYPIISRNQISNNFSLEKYATGELLRGSQNNSKGMW